MLVALDMAVHDRDRAAQADAVRGLHHLEPLGGLDLVRADDRADFVVEDLGRGARQRAEPGVAQLAEEIGEGAAEGLGALPHFERREGMDMQPRHRLLDRAADAEIGGAGIFRVDAALQADFGRAALPRFLAAPDDLVHVEVVGPAAQILAELALREGAELAAEIADVGVVDVAGDDIGDRVAIDLAAQPVGRGADQVESIAARLEQGDDVAFAEGFAGGSAGEDRFQRCGKRRIPHAFAGGGRVGVGAGAPRIGAREALRIEGAQGGGAQRRVEPARRVGRIFRVDRQPLDQQLAGRGGAPRQEVEGRPRRLGVDVVGGHRRHPAPIVDPGGDHRLERVGHQIGRRLDVHRRPEDQPGDGDRPQMIGSVGLGRRRHPGIGFSLKVLDDNFLYMSMIFMQVTQGQQRLDTLAPGLADADEECRW